jgi:uncharacterized protein (TIGR03435 family)
MFVERPISIDSFTANFHVRLIDSPTRRLRAAPLPAQALFDLRGVLLHPMVDRGVINRHAAFAHHLLEIAVAYAIVDDSRASAELAPMAPDANSTFEVATIKPSIKQWQSMVMKLMADRFQLKSHYVKRELPVYLITVAKSGPKLRRGDLHEPAGLGRGPGNLGATNATMADLAELLGHGFLDRPVVDQTGLAGKFDVRLIWTPDEMQSATQNADAPPGIFTAIQEQLGLKLVRKLQRSS